MEKIDDDLIIRRKPNLKNIYEELKLIKSYQDIGYFWQKAAFLYPRMAGTVDRFTEVPPSIQIEPTNSCNLMCITCGRSTSTRKVGKMDFDLFTKIIDDAASIGVKRVQLFIMGEPLLHPRIVDMIRYVKAKNLGFHLTTNGLMLNEKIIDGILGAGVTSADYVTISILGYSKEVHEKIMRGVNHDRIWANIENFIAKRKALKVNGPVLETVFYSISMNEHELEPFKKYWANKVDHVIDGGHAVEAFINQSIPTVPRTHSCAMLWERMAVQWNGDVVLCGEDMDGAYKIGSMIDQSIKEVWQGEKLMAYKQLHKERRFSEIPICQYCDW
jgi:radical SAM protein with 4Fe4S-binding SPASM domain